MPDDVKDLQAALEQMAANLGIPVSFEGDAALANYKRGKRLTMGEVRALPPKSIVWAYYREHGESEPRINSAHYIEPYEGATDSWSLSEGSSFGCDFTPGPGLYDHAPACEDACGQGMLILYKAVPG